jgi:hypothetical protein
MGAIAQAVGYALMCWGGPFVLFVLAYIPIGFGLGLQGGSLGYTEAGHIAKIYANNQMPRSIRSPLDSIMLKRKCS